MQRALSIALAFCLALTLSLDANAKRFGGGKSFGAAPSHQTRQVQPQSPSSTATPTAAQRPVTPATGASRWLGPLAGLAAGGLLASLFMGGGFQGFQFFDFLILALIAFVIFRVLAARRARQQPAMAGHGAYSREAAQPERNLFGSRASVSTASPVIDAPAWFDEKRFVEAAREHFMSLQQHWDSAEMDKIAEYVTPQMLDFLKRERAEIGDAYQSTYIDDLQVQLDGVDDNPDKTVATLTFTGVAKTSRFDQGEPFSESWRMERAQGADQPWRVAGIRQN